MPLLLVLFFLYVEISVSIWFAHLLGGLGTFVWLLGALLLGVNLLRVQGPASMLRAARDMQSGTGQPGTALMDGLFKSIAAILLIIPGIISDVLGLLCLVPWLRRLLLRRWLARMTAQGRFQAQMFEAGQFTQRPFDGFDKADAPFGEGNVYEHQGSTDPQAPRTPSASDSAPLEHKPPADRDSPQ